MPRLTLALIIVVSLLILYRISSKSPYMKILSHIDTGPTRSWNVVKDYNNNQDAAALMSRMNSIMIEFFRRLKKKYHIDESDDLIAAEYSVGDYNIHQAAVNTPGDIYNLIDHLLNNYNPDVFYENDPRYSSDTSYTVNKGQKMFVCLRRKDNPNILVDENILLFVFLHEITHDSNYNGWGHERDFWIIFKMILHEAYLAGIYSPVDYAKAPVDYCGLLVNYNPYFDDGLPNLWEKKTV